MTKSDQAPGFQIPEQTIFGYMPCDHVNPSGTIFLVPWKSVRKIFKYLWLQEKKNKQDVQLVLKARWNGACILLQQAMMITEHVGHHL